MNIKRAIAYLTLAALLASVSGCAVDTAPPHTSAKPSADVDIAITPSPLQVSGIRYSLQFVEKRDVAPSGCTFSYPYVCNDGMRLLNISIRQTVNDVAANYDDNYNVTYGVVYNHLGLLSVMLKVTDTRSGNSAEYMPVNFDVDSGLQISIADCFGSGSQTWRATLPDMISEKATAMGYTIIGYMPPIDDSQLFYFWSGGVAFYYRKYELCTADAGSPSFLFSVYSVWSLLGSDSILLSRFGTAD